MCETNIVEENKRKPYYFLSHAVRTEDEKLKKIMTERKELLNQLIASEMKAITDVPEKMRKGN